MFWTLWIWGLILLAMALLLPVTIAAAKALVVAALLLEGMALGIVVYRTYYGR